LLDSVNCIAPGFIDTKMTEVLTEDQKRKILDNIPMKKMGTGEEIAARVLFLASDEAKYITGHVLNISQQNVMSYKLFFKIQGTNPWE
jgi:3-oxoacyl-[acyl-carrier protein] reductase